MFNNLGIQWAATLIGCLAAVMVPIPILFYIYGGRIRAKSEFAPTKKEPVGEKVDGENAV